MFTPALKLLALMEQVRTLASDWWYNEILFLHYKINYSTFLRAGFLMKKCNLNIIFLKRINNINNFCIILILLISSLYYFFFVNLIFVLL